MLERPRCGCPRAPWPERQADPRRSGAPFARRTDRAAGAAIQRGRSRDARPLSQRL